MPAPTAADGAARGIEELGPPSAVAILLVVLAYHFYGDILAGLLLLGVTILGLIVLISLAKYWNAAYTAGFVIFGFLALIMIPGLLGELVHPAFNILTTIAVLVALVVIGSLLISKLDLDASSRR